MRPYVTRKIVNPQGEVLVENQPHVVRRVISEKTAKLLASMLRDVTNEGGTGVAAKIEGFEVAGKTGTAQKAERGGYSAKKRVSSFVGFVPADNPRLVSLVLVDEPEGNVYGGVVAAPAFRNIAQGALAPARGGAARRRSDAERIGASRLFAGASSQARRGSAGFHQWRRGTGFPRSEYARGPEESAVDKNFVESAGQRLCREAGAAAGERRRNEADGAQSARMTEMRVSEFLALEEVATGRR